MPKTLVLGANGFIGSHLVDALVERGDDVVAFGRYGGEVNFKPNPRIAQFYGDFLNESDLERALEGVDYVYHLISTTTPATAEDDPTIDIRTNVSMSIELFRLCVEAGVKRVYFASTGGSIYGANPNPPYAEDDLPLPVSPYAIGKLTIEHYLRYFRQKHNLDSVVFRISNPYGERQPFHRKQGVIPIFIENIYRGVPINVYGDGSMVRDYLYVGDVVRMITSMGTNESRNKVYNIGSGMGVPVNHLIEMAEKVVGKKAEINHIDVPSTFVKTAVLDTTRFREEFSIEPITSLEDGMRKTYEYIRQQIEDGNV